MTEEPRDALFCYTAILQLKDTGQDLPPNKKAYIPPYIVSGIGETHYIYSNQLT